MKTSKVMSAALICALAAGAGTLRIRAQNESTGFAFEHLLEGKRLFEQETFGGNGRTCVICHNRETGTVSPEEAQKRFARNPRDPLFLHDGSDDGKGNGVTRMLSDATFLVEIPLPPNVSLADDPKARSVILKRGTPTTLNTPALDPVLMLDGREPNLESQAAGAIRSHYQNGRQPRQEELKRIAEFQKTPGFFSSLQLLFYAYGGPAPRLPNGRTESEKRGKRFFEDEPFAPGKKEGVCALCHSGPMLNETNRFVPFQPPGSRFSNVAVSEFNTAGNRVRDFIFKNPVDGSTTIVHSPDPGRALITGRPDPGNFDNLNAFKIPTLWDIRHTAPYFHDNSAKTLEQVADHYQRFFKIVANPVLLTDQDKADMVAYMKLLN
jgi:cytochrome c peroxidase